MLLGHDLSTVLQCEKIGVKYHDFDSECSEPPERIAVAHGANLMRIRVWVHPPAGYSDFDSMLEMAQRAKDAGMKTLLCLHLSDYWADPGKQFTPAAWTDQDFPTLCNTVAAYITHLIQALEAQSTPPFMVAVGNEISNGMLWPTGKVSNTFQFTTLLKRGLAAVQEKGIATMVHINNGQDKQLVTWFMDMMEANDVEFDYLGLSFYPGDGASLSDLEVSLALAAGKYKRKMVIAEVADYYTPLPNAPSTQESSLAKLMQVVRDVPDGLGAGVCYWEPAWVAPGEAYPGEGTDYWNRSLWDAQGLPLPALRCYEPYAQTSQAHEDHSNEPYAQTSQAHEDHSNEPYAQTSQAHKDHEAL